MEKQSHESGTFTPHGATRFALALAAAMMMTVPVAAQDGFSWRSYAEAGGGFSIASGGLRPLAAFESGIFIGGIELGSYDRALSSPPERSG